MSSTYVTVIGSMNCDISFAIEQFPYPNQTIMAKSSMLSAGGKGLNQAVAAARAGAHSVMVGCVGADAFGARATDYARLNGVDVSGVKRVMGTPTGTAGIFVTKEGENMIAVAPGANACLTPEDIMAHKALIENSAIVVVQLEVPADALRRAMQIANQAGVRIVYNPAPATKEAKALVPFATIITPNETETETLTGIYPRDEKTAKKAAKHLCVLGAKAALITMGAKGYFLHENGRGELFPAFNATAIDPTGAGDVFNGVLAKVLSHGGTLHAAARTASAAGALSVSHAGAEGAAPNWAEIQRFMGQG